MNLSDLVTRVEGFAGKVAQDPARYASALHSGLSALENARAVFAKLHGAATASTSPPSDDAPSPEPPLVRELAEWAAIAETQEADAQVQEEIRHDQDSLTAQEVEDALVSVVKIVALVGKAL